MMPTMNDVAKLSGVSLGSVSNVLNGVKVRASTYEKVMSAVEELGYETNNLARSFKLNQTNTIALIVPTIWHPFFASIAFYVEYIAEKNGYHVYLCNTKSDTETEINYIKMLRKNKVDGIIAITYSEIESYVEGSLPFVSIDRHFGQDISIVSSDNFKGGYLAAETLVEKGAQKLLFVGSHNKISNETMLRRKGFEKYCEENNVEYKIIDLLEPYDDYKTELIELMAADRDIDGIFTINDYLGLDVIQILSTIGLNILEDYQLIGFDGIKMSSERDYQISSIAQPAREIAINAFEILMKKIKQPGYNDQIILPVKFIEGGTTKKEELNKKK